MRWPMFSKSILTSGVSLLVFLLVLLLFGSLVSTLIRRRSGRPFLRLAFALRFALVFRGGLVRCHLLFVTLRSQRRFQVLPQYNHVSTARHRNLEPPHTAGDYGPNVGAGEKVEIFPVFVERRRSRIAQSVRHLVCGFVLDPVHKHASQRAIELPRVGEPATVWRPHGIEARPRAAGVRIG